MKKSAALLCTAVLAACGSSNNLPSGKVANASFSPGNANAAVFSNAACSAGGATVNLSAVALGFSSAGNLCGRFGQACTDTANEELVSVAILNAGAVAQPAVAPGTYQVTSALPSNLSGTFALAYVKKNDAQCNDSQSATSATGTVTITSVDQNRVKGSLNLSFSDGGNFAGSFDVATCQSLGVDVCQALSGCSGNVSCQP